MTFLKNPIRPQVGDRIPSLNWEPGDLTSGTLYPKPHRKLRKAINCSRKPYRRPYLQPCWKLYQKPYLVNNPVAKPSALRARVRNPIKDLMENPVGNPIGNPIKNLSATLPLGTIQRKAAYPETFTMAKCVGNSFGKFLGDPVGNPAWEPYY